MGLKPNEQNEEQAPGEGSNRAARLGFIVLVQAHYWQGQSACGEATLRDLAAGNLGIKRRPFGRLDGTNRGQLGEHQASKMAGLSDGQSQASSSAGHTEGLQQASGHLLDPTGDGGHCSRGQAASLSRTRCHSPRRRQKKPPTRAQGCGTAALAQPLCRVTRSSTAAVACGLHNCAPPQRGPSPMGTTHRCSGWTEDLHRHRGWAPEVA